jgi:hypothetical protein
VSSRRRHERLGKTQTSATEQATLWTSSAAGGWWTAAAGTADDEDELLLDPTGGPAGVTLLLTFLPTGWGGAEDLSASSFSESESCTGQENRHRFIVLRLSAPSTRFILSARGFASKGDRRKASKKRLVESQSGKASHRAPLLTKVKDPAPDADPLPRRKTKQRLPCLLGSTAEDHRARLSQQARIPRQVPERAKLLHPPGA